MYVCIYVCVYLCMYVCMYVQVGRYILASTSAKFNDPESICSIPCDLIFPCETLTLTWAMYVCTVWMHAIDKMNVNCMAYNRLEHHGLE